MTQSKAVWIIQKLLPGNSFWDTIVEIPNWDDTFTDMLKELAPGEKLGYYRGDSITKNALPNTHERLVYSSLKEFDEELAEYVRNG